MVEPKEYWREKAQDLKKSREFEEAIKILDKISEIEKEETAEEFWYNKAKNYFEIKEYEQAKDAINKDLETGNKTFERFFLLGKILYQLKNYEESLENYNKASEEHASKFMKQKLKIEQMKNVRKFEDAVKYSDAVYQTKQLDADYWHHRGKTLLKLGKIDEGTSCLEKSLELTKNET